MNTSQVHAIADTAFLLLSRSLQGDAEAQTACAALSDAIISRCDTESMLVADYCYEQAEENRHYNPKISDRWTSIGQDFDPRIAARV